MTSMIDIGYGHFQNSDDRANDVSFSLGTQYRVATHHHLEARLGHHSLGEGSWLYRVQYGYEALNGALWVQSGFKKELKYDSFLALVGKNLNGRPFGAAHSSVFFVDTGARLRFLTLTATPYIGQVSADSLSDNSLKGIDAISMCP